MKRKVYFLLAGVFMAMLSFAQGPVVYLPLDNDLSDASGNGNDATDAGVIATSFVNDAERGMVAFFDTASHATLPLVDALKFGAGQDFSFAMWMKINRIGGDPVIIGNKDWGSGQNKGFCMYSKNADVVGSPNCGINFGDGKTAVGGSNERVYWTAFENGAPDCVDDNWHFVAVSFDRDDTIRVWIDGEQQYSNAALSLMPGMAWDDDNNYPFTIMEDGTGTYNEGAGLKGYIDELRVWNRVITDADVQEIYESSSAGEGPVVYLPLDNDLTDASGNGNDATDAGVIATSFVNDPQRGMVAFFDTASHATLPLVDALKFGAGQDFSFAMWMKINRIGGDPVIIGNKDWGSGQNKGFCMYSKNADVVGSPNCGINFGDGKTAVGGSNERVYWTAFENGAPDCVDDNWHFVAVSFDRDDTIRVWIDGEQQYSNAALSLMPGMAWDDDNNYPFTIMEDGTGSYNEGAGLKGYIDELRVWNRVITDTDVQEIYEPLSVGDGPVVYLPLDNDLSDASGNGNDATDAGAIATSFVNDPQRGMVAFFDTASHATLPLVDALKFGAGQDFSFAMWMKINRVGGDPVIIGNKDWGSGQNKGFCMYSKNADVVGSPNCGINFGDGKTAVGGSNERVYWTAFENGAPDCVDDNWHFVAVSFDRDDTIRVWIDGEQQYSNAALSLMPGMAWDDDNNYPFTIMEDGTGTYNEGAGLKGYIDELRVWNRVITDTDIQQIYSPITSIYQRPSVSLSSVVYPNPANSEVNLKFNSKKSGTAQISIYNSAGMLQKGFSYSTVSGQNIATFDVRGWRTGIYLVRVASESNSETVRLVVTE
ncbi:T9SS C-terminal target domain-containing protein [Mariniphaga sediminis]|uniref:T9SS C-terminal target domain-containing protein n=1 Tax=Mariniphaga sediminis TaxID=1628158 RepID=A0A399D8V6_9BACT|nr:LamG-like jellyroll fold domain-containing protein [Mariniphaga sediminis]RIH66901.1 T9SS C-terminal target domain-containing protein [Mariniphaga sediminis]